MPLPYAFLAKLAILQNNSPHNYAGHKDNPSLAFAFVEPCKKKMKPSLTKIYKLERLD